MRWLLVSLSGQFHHCSCLLKPCVTMNQIYKNKLLVNVNRKLSMFCSSLPLAVGVYKRLSSSCYYCINSWLLWLALSASVLYDCVTIDSTPGKDYD